MRATIGSLLDAINSNTGFLWIAACLPTPALLECRYMEENFSDATTHDMSRPAATGSDTDYTLSLEEVSDRYAKAGHPRTLRSLQRYCVNGHLDAQKLRRRPATSFWSRHCRLHGTSRKIEEFTALESVRDWSRRAATCRDTCRRRTSALKTTHIDADDMPRQAPTDGDNIKQKMTAKATCRAMSRGLEREVEQAKDERDFLREQIDRKDRTIDSLLERDRETNFLIRGLQELIPRLGIGRELSPNFGDGLMDQAAAVWA